MKIRPYFMAPEVTLTSALPMPSTVPHSGQVLSWYVLVGIGLIPRGRGGKKEEDIGSWEAGTQVRGLGNGPSSVGPVHMPLT